jgi:hypothetical protein
VSLTSKNRPKRDLIPVDGLTHQKWVKLPEAVELDDFMTSTKKNATICMFVV